MTEQEYRELPALHYSLLKDFADHPSKVIQDAPKRTRGLFYGSIADCLLFSGEAGFKKNYMVCDLERPGEKMGLLVEWIIQNADWARLVNDRNQLNDEYFNEVSLEGADVVQWNVKWGRKARIENIRKAALEYMEKIVEAGERQIVTSSEYSQAQQLVKGFRSSEFTARYFTNSSKVKLMTQVPVVWMYDLNGERIKIKELVDLMMVVADRKIILPYDVKSMGGHVGSFSYWYMRLRYYIQQSLYTEGLRAAARGDGQVFIDDPQGNEDVLDITGWTIKPMRFIVGSYKTPLQPLCFKTDENDVEFGKKGGIINNRQYVGWEKLIEDIVWHQENNLWDYTREAYEGKGIVPLTYNIDVDSE